MTGKVCLLGWVASILCFTGCKSTYYATMEKFGVHKRDMLKENVEEARDEQKKATEQFSDALTRLRELYNINGGDLEKTYDRLKADFDRSEERATAVRTRIGKVETVAADLFREWEKEIAEMESSRLASQSREKLRVTQQKYESLHTAMKRAETSMDPVLKQFRDQVLYLKHNLNAQAIGALKGETLDIEKEIQQLIKDMNVSIQQADSFIQGLESTPSP
ncbi:MAG TPA: DUF2959 domain-containing protein [Candidatus Kapabacteria bacterium]|nr:DUF2959 domain-containing protein [Candidatus Kapabacteria bacterium]